MKIFFLILYVWLYIVSADTFSVMSYNVRGYFPCDNFLKPSHHWYYRHDKIIDIIQKESPDILGVQEVFNIKAKEQGKCKQHSFVMGYDFDPLVKKDIKELKRQKIVITPPRHLIRDFIREKLKRMGYSYFYQAGGSPKIIFFKKRKFVFLDGGTFYQNKGKSTTYLFLKHKQTKKTLLVINTHFIAGRKHSKTRKKNIDTLIDKIKALNAEGVPMVVLGDFNIRYKSKNYDYLVRQLQSVGMKEIANKEYTFHDFGKKKRKLDYIFYTKPLHLIKSETVNFVFDIKTKRYLRYQYHQTSKNILFASDHWPLKAVFKIDEGS